jgi:hypothetical protein
MKNSYRYPGDSVVGAHAFQPGINGSERAFDFRVRKNFFFGRLLDFFIGKNEIRLNCKSAAHDDQNETGK